MSKTYFAIPGDINAVTGGYAYDRKLLSMLPTLGIKPTHIELPARFPNPTAADLKTTADILARLEPDATVLIDGLAFGAMPVETIKSCPARIIALVHHPLAFEPGLDATERDRLQTSERAALGEAAHIIATGPTMAPILRDTYNVPDAKLTIAIPGTNPAIRATGTGTPFQMLSVGALTPRKGYDHLIEALAPLASQPLTWRMHIVGAHDRCPETTARIKAMIDTHDLGEHIALPGVVVPATLERHYESADVFVMPTLFEGYGMVLAEAMASGLPIVCTTGGAAAHTVPDAAALKVPPGDADALRDAITTVMRDKKLQTRLADASWEAGRALPTWNETVRRVAARILDIDA